MRVFLDLETKNFEFLTSENFWGPSPENFWGPGPENFWGPGPENFWGPKMDHFTVLIKFILFKRINLVWVQNFRRFLVR